MLLRDAEKLLPEELERDISLALEGLRHRILDGEDYYSAIQSGLIVDCINTLSSSNSPNLFRAFMTMRCGEVARLADLEGKMREFYESGIKDQASCIALGRTDKSRFRVFSKQGNSLYVHRLVIPRISIVRRENSVVSSAPSFAILYGKREDWTGDYRELAERANAVSSDELVLLDRFEKCGSYKERMSLAVKGHLLTLAMGK